jgi:hypothetical protein
MIVISRGTPTAKIAGHRAAPPRPWHERPGRAGGRPHARDELLLLACVLALDLAEDHERREDQERRRDRD